MTDREFDPREALREAYDNAQIEDADRSETEEAAGRQLIMDLPAAWPHKMSDHTRVKLPIRVVWDGFRGVGIEFGPYDLCDVDVQMIRQAIAVYDQSGGESWLVPNVITRSTETADDVHDLTDVVDFLTGQPMTRRAYRLRHKEVPKPF